MDLAPPSSAPAPVAFTALSPPERRTVPEIFFHGVDHLSREDAVLTKAEDAWTPVSHADVAQRAARLAAYLHGLGLERGDRVAILSENRLEWAVADYAALGLGLVDVPIYPTLPADQTAYILENAGVRLVFASTREQWEKVLSVRDRLPALAHVVGFDDPAGAPGVTPLAEALAAPPPEGAADPLGWWRSRAEEVAPEDTATIIYTSGTTGPPKGVVLTHHNLAVMVAATRQHGALPLEPGDVALSFLPLSHIFERAVDYYYWDCGACIAYAESTARVAANLKEVRPHAMVSVPRLFEMIYDRVHNVTGARRWVLDRAEDAGGRVVEARLHDRRAALDARLVHTAGDRLVFRRLREAVGGRIKMFISGGAALRPDVARFFFAAGLPIYEGYGLTETSPVLTANGPGRTRLGSVGVPFPGVEVRLGDRDEILARTPGLMKGYWDDPEATAAVIDEDGWFHTGDVGEIDADGYLCITDRIKDLIVTTGGKNIAPQPIEAKAQQSPFVQHAVLVGDRRPHPVLLVAPDVESVRTWSKAEGLHFEGASQLLEHEDVARMIRREVMGALEGLATHERPKKVAILPEPLSIEAGMLTPTLKVRRRAVERHFADLIDGLYG